MQDSLTHLRSRKNLIGESFTKEQMDKFSMELQIHDDMPPVFSLQPKMIRLLIIKIVLH
jgi:hypothetical protein